MTFDSKALYIAPGVFRDRLLVSLCSRWTLQYFGPAENARQDALKCTNTPLRGIAGSGLRYGKQFPNQNSGLLPIGRLERAQILLVPTKG